MHRRWKADLFIRGPLGSERDAAPIYGSGGFTSYDDDFLVRQLSGWVESGISRVKMKVGRDPRRDLRRVERAREAIGPEVQLFVDANGAWRAKEALRMAYRLADLDVRWLEEPVSSDDLPGLSLVREQGPPGIDVAAGEYGWDERYFSQMIAAGAVDVLQADATRCGGITGFLRAAAIADAAGIPISAHCAPALHSHLGCVVARLAHLEWFHDHVRIESRLFERAPSPKNGAVASDRTRPGLGLAVREDVASRYRSAA